jgi:hypothetical protein
MPIFTNDSSGMAIKPKAKKGTDLGSHQIFIRSSTFFKELLSYTISRTHLNRVSHFVIIDLVNLKEIYSNRVRS